MNDSFFEEIHAASRILGYELSAEETAAFTEACQTVYEYWVSLVGQDTLDAWLATVPQ